MHRYIANTKAQKEAMLRRLGLARTEELFTAIPAALRLAKPLDLPAPLSEMELREHMRGLARQNQAGEDCAVYLGAGIYDHYIPALVSHLLSRQEFYTAYTPYQAEISQGTLQAIFEYQSLICRLTGMDVANASVYDGATAAAEAVCTAQAIRPGRALISATLHPETRQVIQTYARFRGLDIVEVAMDEATGSLDLEALRQQLAAAALDQVKISSIVVPNPNFFGVLEDVAAIADQTQASGALLIVSQDPISLGLLKAPGDLGADIVVGDGQALGNPMSFGGPTLGYFAVKKKCMRKMPGRVVGQATDSQGRRGFVLTMQAREQHIRREKATSNICTNQALNALAATIYLAAVGPDGLQEAAKLSALRAHDLYRRLLETGLFEPCFSGSFFKEFTVRYRGGSLKDLNRKLLQDNIIGGLDLGTYNPAWQQVWLLAVTEKRSPAQIDILIDRITAYAASPAAKDRQGAR